MNNGVASKKSPILMDQDGSEIQRMGQESLFNRISGHLDSREFKKAVDKRTDSMVAAIAERHGRIIASGKMVSTVENVYPEEAAWYLEQTHPDFKNRNLKSWWINDLAAMAVSKEWKVTHQGLAFDENGYLIDGQHRLHACVLAGIPIKVMITWNVRREGLLAIDNGARRNDGDVARMTGFDATAHHFAVVRAMFETTDSTVDIPRSEVFRLLEIHSEAVRFSQKYRPNRKALKGIGHAVPRAVVARAYYSADRQRLDDFLKAYGSGEMAGPEDVAAVKLRNLMLQDSPRGSRAYKLSLYNKAQSAVLAFLERRPIKYLQETTGVLYPVPVGTEAMHLIAAKGNQE